MSCATPPRAILPSPSLDYAAHQKRLADLKHWKLKGKIGFKSAQDTLSATIHWQQQDQHYRIRLTSVLGSTLMEMKGHNGFAELHVDDNHYFDDDAEQLLERVTGWQLPVNQLASLIKGQIPDDDFEVLESEPNWPTAVRGSSLSSWKIRYDQYRETQYRETHLGSAPPVWLPYELRLTKAKNLIKIRVTSWEIHE